MDAPPVPEEHLGEIYTWVDQFQLSRPKRNISRDFADGFLVAEIMHQLLPRFIDLHNYSQAHSLKEKLYNWNTLNSKEPQQEPLSASMKMEELDLPFV